MPRRKHPHIYPALTQEIRWRRMRTPTIKKSDARHYSFTTVVYKVLRSHFISDFQRRSLQSSRRAHWRTVRGFAVPGVYSKLESDSLRLPGIIACRFVSTTRYVKSAIAMTHIRGPRSSPLSIGLRQNQRDPKDSYQP